MGRKILYTLSLIKSNSSHSILHIFSSGNINIMSQKLEIILKCTSDSLSVITIGICLVMKIPQINKILESKMTVGISVTSLFLELIRYKRHSILIIYKSCDR